MADYIATTRSNYFRVQDGSAFEAWCTRRDLEFWKDNAGERYAIASNLESGWPSYEDETDDEIDLSGELAAHLHASEVAVLMEVGSEKLRYLNGEAVAVGANGHLATVNLADIYDLARKAAPGATVTEAAY